MRLCFTDTAGDLDHLEWLLRNRGAHTDIHTSNGVRFLGTRDPDGIRVVTASQSAGVPAIVPGSAPLQLTRCHGRTPTNGCQPMPNRPDVRVARVYEPAPQEETTRILVDRIWPRGLSKSRANLDEWCKAVAPSTELRAWYAHTPSRFEEFARRYRAELGAPEQAAALSHLRQLAAQGHLTLLTATKALDISQAAVLAELIAPGRSGSRSRSRRRQTSPRFLI